MTIQLTARDALLEAVAAADERRALAVAKELLDGGMTPAQLLLDVVAPVQRQVGRLWQSNEWSVAQEHAATAINERVITVATTRAAGAVPVTPKGHVVVACLDGEWHAIPPRIVGEILRESGWQVTFLGTSVPTSHLVSYLHQHGPDVVALSCTLSRSLPRAHQVITACRNTGTRVLVGGLGFGSHGQWAHALGVTSWAADAREAARLLDEGEPGEPGPAWRVRGADAEYTGLRSRRTELISGTMARLGERFPPLLAYDERQRDATIEDLGHIVDFLAAALYIDEPALFRDFLDWTAEVLRARNVPLQSLDLTLAVLGETLADFPRTQGFLAAVPPFGTRT
jgi:methanogenic corrinoid protein MtbC1